MGIYVVQRGINKRTSRAKGGHSPYEAFFGKKTGNGPKDILDKHIVEQCLTEAALEAAVAFVQSDEHSMDVRLALNFNDRIIQVIRTADAAFEEEDAEEESMKPTTVDERAAVAVGSVDVEGTMKLEADSCARKEDLVEEVMKTANADEEPTIDEAATSTEDTHTASAPTKASTHHQSDTPRRGKIRVQMAAAQAKQAIAVNKSRKSTAYVEFLKVGDMCKIEVEGNTRAATDYKYLPVKITACKQKSSRSGKSTSNQYQIASRDGYLEGWYARENLEYDPMINVKIAGIDTEKEGFLKELTIARASALYNQNGGATTCQCKSDCAENNRCRCKKAGNFCTSKCHGGRGKNSKCTNCMPAAVDVHNPSPPGPTPPQGSNNLCTEVNDVQQPINQTLPTNRAPTPDNDRKAAAIEVRGGNPGKYDEQMFADEYCVTRAPTPDNEKKRAAKQVPDNDSAVDDVVNPAAKRICKEKEEVKLDDWGEPYPYHEVRAGCVLQYYHPLSVAGTPGALREATVLEIKPSIFDADEFTLVMDNLDILNSSHQAKLIKEVVNGELVDRKCRFRDIENYEIIQSKIGSIREVVQRGASSFRRLLGANVNRDAPEGMPVDILKPQAEKSAVDGCPLMETAKELNLDEDEEDEEARMDTKDMTRLNGLKLEAALKNKILDLDQQCIVNGAINGSGPLHEVLASSNGDQVQRKAMQRLRPEVWLDDEVVNYFLKNCLQSREEKMHSSNTNQKRSHFFNSFFVQKLFDEKNGNANQKGRYNYSNVKTWYKKVPGRNIFNLERIFFPANVNSNHWTLTVVFMEEKRIQFYDSLNKKGGNGEKYLNGILAYLQDEHKRQFKSDMDTSGWSLVPSTKATPQQTKYNKKNCYDCGVFVCLFADFIALDCDPIFDFDEGYINKCRELIALSIMENYAIDHRLIG